MFWTATKRIVKSGFVSFWRNGFISVTSILVMTITLFVIGSLIFVNAILDSSLEQITNKVDVNVYFLTDAEEDAILTLKNSIEKLPEVASVEYITREEALHRFEERHQDDQLTLQALEELDENPLGASLSIKAKETSQYEGIANFLQVNATALSNEGTPVVDKVNFFQNRVAIDRLTQIINSAEKFGLAVTIVLSVASILIVFNTIRLAIYTARDEISVMQLVGASHSYIRGPFVFEGSMYGLSSAFVTLVLIYPIALWLGPSTERFFGGINIFEYYTAHFAQISAIIVITGIVLGAVSSYLAVRKYLRV